MTGTNAALESGTDEREGSAGMIPVVYEELRRLAAYRLKGESGNQTLQATALVHEAWLRVYGDGDASWQSKAHFFAAAAQAMRHVLVDRARSKAAIKRKSAVDDPGFGGSTESNDHILMIHESLTLLEKEDPEGAKVVLLKFYGGLSSTEIAKISGSSARSVERQWTLAKARLYQIICSDTSPGDR